MRRLKILYLREKTQLDVTAFSYLTESAFSYVSNLVSKTCNQLYIV